jgi:hypothetical protein
MMRCYEGRGGARTQTQCWLVLLTRLLQLGTTAIVSGALWAQMPPPPPMDRPPARDERSFADRLADSRQKRDHTRAVDTTAQRALEYATVYLDRADKALKSGQPFVCGRLLSAADALRHVALLRERLHEPDPTPERDRHHGQDPVHDGDRPPGLDHFHDGGDGPPSSADALEWVYFRVQQADYFYEQSHDTEAKAFPKWARDFYQLAARDIDRRDLVAAEVNARCAEEVVRALENLAQAAAPMPPHGDPHPHPPGMQDGPGSKPEPRAGQSASTYTKSEEISA